MKQKIIFVKFFVNNVDLKKIIENFLKYFISYVRGKIKEYRILVFSIVFIFNLVY